MPKIHLTLSGNENPALAKELVIAVSQLTKDLLNKKPEVTVVTVSFIPDSLWFINSRSLEELLVSSFYLEIKISDSTNLKDHKSSFIAAIHQALSGKIPSIHPVSYTVIDEVKTDAYGYEGLTIEFKYINNQLKQAK